MRTSIALFAAALWCTSACSDDTGAGGGGANGGGANGAGTSDGGSAGGGGSPAAGGGGGGGGAPNATIPFVYVGTEEGAIDGYLLDRDTGALTATTSIDVGGNPSFLAASPDHTRLYAVDEASGQVIALAIDTTTGALTELGRASSEGAGPAYVSVDATGDWVLVANYGGGTVAVLPVLADGGIGDAVDVESPGENPHLIRTDPTNTFAFVPCLGSDHVARFSFDDATGQLEELSPPAPLPAGTGPRHLEFHAGSNVLYVIGELGDSLTTFARDDAGGLSLLATVSTLPDGVDGADNACADLHEHPNGGFLYGSNRGHDSIAVFALDAGGAATRVADVPTGGSWPRNFGIDPEGRSLLVANQHTDDVVVFSIDPASGALASKTTTPTGAGPSWVGVVTQPAPE